MRVCEWFDRYRDGDLDLSLREKFETHLAGCSDCRARSALLDNMVRALQIDAGEAPSGLPERIARRAFEQRSSWDELIISWMRPVPALIALVVTMFIFSSIWLVPSAVQKETYGEYEALLNESDALHSGSTGATHSDDELIRALVEEGTQR